MSVTLIGLVSTILPRLKPLSRPLSGTSRTTPWPASSIALLPSMMSTVTGIFGTTTLTFTHFLVFLLRL